MQRLRIRFNRDHEVKFISHLEIVRLWQRAFIRAGITLAYSEGFSPHPRISLAAPLPVGVTSEAELMDIVVVKGVAPHYFTSAVNKQLPAGIEIMKVHPISAVVPSLQSQISHAEYRVTVNIQHGPVDIPAAINNLMNLEKLAWHHQRDTGLHSYDLRALIDKLWIIELTPDAGILGMRLLCGNRGSGRPEQVTNALGFSQRPESIHRTNLILTAV